MFAHFGRLSELQASDVVVFTDVSGTAHYYEVVILETLPKAENLLNNEVKVYRKAVQ